MALTDGRLRTGIPGFDEALQGGLVASHSGLLVGAAGTGKTIASLQWLLDGRRHGRKGLYVTLAEPIENIKRNVTGPIGAREGLRVSDEIKTLYGILTGAPSASSSIPATSEVGY